MVKFKPETRAVMARNFALLGAKQEKEVGREKDKQTNDRLSADRSLVLRSARAWR